MGKNLGKISQVKSAEAARRAREIGLDFESIVTNSPCVMQGAVLTDATSDDVQWNECRFVPDPDGKEGEGVGAQVHYYDMTRGKNASRTGNELIERKENQFDSQSTRTRCLDAWLSVDGEHYPVNYKIKDTPLNTSGSWQSAKGGDPQNPRQTLGWNNGKLTLSSWKIEEIANGRGLDEVFWYLNNGSYYIHCLFPVEKEELTDIDGCGVYLRVLVDYAKVRNSKEIQPAIATGKTACRKGMPNVKYVPDDVETLWGTETPRRVGESIKRAYSDSTGRYGAFSMSAKVFMHSRKQVEDDDGEMVWQTVMFKLSKDSVMHDGKVVAPLFTDLVMKDSDEDTLIPLSKEYLKVFAAKHELDEDKVLMLEKMFDQQYTLV